jgi:hypothetical protein
LDTRILITIVLALGLIFAYQELVIKRLYPPPDQTASQPTAESSSGVGQPGAPGVASSSTSMSAAKGG